MKIGWCLVFSEPTLQRRDVAIVVSRRSKTTYSMQLTFSIWYR